MKAHRGTENRTGAAESSAAYPLGGTAAELERLLAQARGYEFQANRLLDQIDVQPGWRALDIGCGPIGILNLLSARVGSHGHVVGLEREERFVDMARAEIARRGLDNVQIVQADALSSGLPRESFDVVHARLVMVNVSAREQLLTEMIALACPGATIVLEEIDNVSWLCHPAHPSWTVFIDAFHTMFHANGGNGFIGRAIPGMMQAAGLQSVQTQIDVDTPLPGDYRRTHLVSLMDSLRDKLIERGVIGEQELVEHRSALLAHLERPETVVIDKLFVQAWGRKPS
jgi:ubiquinone/menaquinone biosynthesis C-methylase UbiE